jgi:amidase
MATLPDAKSTTQTSSQLDWKTRARTRKQQQTDSIPPEWIIAIPNDQQNVTRIPYECGLLSALELEITDTLDVAVILEKLRSGTWSSVQVTRAFYKRAIVAHQAVGFRIFDTNTWNPGNKIA